jgi:hypothetical protein
MREAEYPILTSGCSEFCNARLYYRLAEDFDLTGDLFSIGELANCSQLRVLKSLDLKREWNVRFGRCRVNIGIDICLD